METASKNKLVMKNTLMLYFRMFLIMGVTLYTSRIVLEALGEVDYGIYNVVAGVVVMIDFINAALYGATIRFMTFIMDTGDEQARKRTFSSIKFVHLAIGFISLLLGETIGLWFVMNKLTIPETSLVAALWTYQCSLAVLFISEISLPYSALIMAYEKMSAFAYISIIEAILKLGIAFIILYSSTNKLILYSFLFLSIQIIIRIAYLYYCNNNFTESKVKVQFHKDDIRQIGQFASWSIIGTFSGIVSNQGQNILLNIYFGPIVNAARGIANQVHVACMKFCSNFQVAVKPQIIKSYSVGELERMHSLMLYSVKLCLFLCLIIITPLFFFTEPILNIWLVDFPSETVFFVKIVLLQEIFNSISYPLISAIEATGKIKIYKILISIAMLLSLPISYIALKFGHISADQVMLIYLAGSFLTEIVRVLYVLPMIQLSIVTYLKKIVLYAIIPFIILTVTYLLSPHYTKMNFFPLVCNIIIVCFGTLLVLYVFGLNKTERLIAHQYIVRLITRIRNN